MEPLGKKYVAFFDIDKTILRFNSGPVLVREAYRQGLMSTPNLLNAIYLSFLYKFNLSATIPLIYEMGKWLKGSTPDELNKLSECIVNKYLIDGIRPEIFSEINFHREKNGEIVILSSVLVQIGRLLGSHIGADNVICTTMEVADGVFTGLPENGFCIEDEKRVRLIQYCETRNYKVSEAFYYGDSIADLQALGVVGYPVCVKPDRKLSRIAAKKGWRII